MPAVVATNVRVTLAGVRSRCALYPRPTIRTSSARTPPSPCERVSDSFPGYTFLRRGPLSIARAVVDPRVKRRATRVISRATEEGEEKAEEAEVEGSPEERVSNAMQEFAEAGFPSDEDDAKDPVSRTKAMNSAVDDLYSLMDSEVQVLSEAFDLLEQLGVKGLEKPPKSLRRDDKKETIELEKDENQ